MAAVIPLAVALLCGCAGLDVFEAALFLLGCPLSDVVDNADCGGHAVVLVGYATRVDVDGVSRTFFKLRNSWGPAWSAQGYGWMSAAYLDQLGVAGYLIRAE